MGRPKKFTREEVLEKVIPIFWVHGFNGACLGDLEKATGVNKSGLYAEFKSKEALFLASLQHYLDNSTGKSILSRKPLGWENVKAFLDAAMQCTDTTRGCFAINSMREFAVLPADALKLISTSKAGFKRLLIKNIAAEKTRMEPTAIADLVSTFFSGLCVDQNLKTSRSVTQRKTQSFMEILRSI